MLSWVRLAKSSSLTCLSGKFWSQLEVRAGPWASGHTACPNPVPRQRPLSTTWSAGLLLSLFSFPCGYQMMCVHVGVCNRLFNWPVLTELLPVCRVALWLILSPWWSSGYVTEGRAAWHEKINNREAALLLLSSLNLLYHFILLMTCSVWPYTRTVNVDWICLKDRKNIA